MSNTRPAPTPYRWAAVVDGDVVVLATTYQEALRAAGDKGVVARLVVDDHPLTQKKRAKRPP